MKLRLQSNSLRLRLTRREVERLRDSGSVKEALDFGDGEVLVYCLESRPEPGPVRAASSHGTVTVSLSREAAEAWAASEEVGIYAQSGRLTIAIEKDFRCLVPRPEDQDSDAYPNPGALRS